MEIAKDTRRRISLSGMLRKLGVSRSGYKAYLAHKPTESQLRKERIKKRIREIHDSSHQNYGAPKIARELHKEGEEFISNGWEKPQGLCESAWQSMSHYVFALSHDGGNFLKDWMKDPASAVISCNDGCRPVIFLLERIED